jgi:hypothetical protein
MTQEFSEAATALLVPLARFWRAILAGIRRLGQLKAISAISLTVAALAVIFYFAGMHFKHEVRHDIHWQYWLEVLTSNWSADQLSPEKPDPEKGFIRNSEYIAGTVAALVVNLGSFVLIFGALWKVWKTERSRVMEIATALRDRDSIVIATIQGMFRDAELPAEEKMRMVLAVETFFNKGANDWATKYLQAKTAKNKEEAQQIIEVLKPTR